MEALLHETLLFVKSTRPPEHSLQVRIPAAVDVSLGDKIGLAIAPEKVGLFDAKTGDTTAHSIRDKCYAHAIANALAFPNFPTFPTISVADQKPLGRNFLTPVRDVPTVPVYNSTHS